MDIFKQALIGADMAIAQPKTHTFTPVATNTKDIYDEFTARLTQITTTLVSGWGGWSLNFQDYNEHMFILRAVCPHNQTVEVAISSYLMTKAPTYGGGIAMADEAFARMVGVCQSLHVNIPPAGQFIWSIAQTEPVGFVPVSGVPIPMEQFKQQYEGEWSQEYFAQLNSEVVAGYLSYQGLTGSIGTVGSSTASIFHQLAAVCPALNTVQRPCPEPLCENQGYKDQTLGALIPHINDDHNWSREKIADWLDIIALDPDVDLTIKPKKEVANAQPSIGPSKQEEIAALGFADITALAKEYAW